VIEMKHMKTFNQEIFFTVKLFPCEYLTLVATR